jgi:flagellar basal body-associated protein FliL
MSREVAAMKGTRRSLLYVITVVLSTIASIGAGTAIWFVSQHRQSVSVSASVAHDEFAQIRARFSRQPALIDMAIRQPNDAAVMTAATNRLRTFNTVIFDTRGGDRLVRISVPYWLARRYARHDGAFQWLGELTFLDDTEFDPERIFVSLGQLERRGPGLVVDYQHKSGGQFISWVD